MSNYKSIPTIYNGIQYRSRLEARWAFFFNYLNIEYYYEYEGFQLPSGWYVPDFFLPKHGWFEIKPLKPNEREWKLAVELSKHLRDSANDYTCSLNAKERVSILVGFPLNEVYDTTETIEYLYMFLEDDGYFEDDAMYHMMSKPEVGIYIDKDFWQEDYETKEFKFITNPLVHKETVNITGLSYIPEICFYCNQETGLCKNLDSSINEFLKTLYKVSTVDIESFKKEFTKNEENDVIVQLRWDCIIAQDKLRDIYKDILEVDKEAKKSCSNYKHKTRYRKSQRVNDAYQMALKHRFY